MQSSFNRRITISASFYILLAIYCLLVSFPWIAAWLTATAVHELGHYIALRLCKVRILSLRIDISGVQMYTEPMSAAEEVLSAIAGPLAALLLLLCFRQIPRVGVCVLVQSGFNLLPIFPWDGGRVCRGIINMFCQDNTGEMIGRYIENITLVLLFLIGCGLLIRYHLGIFPLVVWLFVFLKSRKIKIPCKQGKLIVQ